MSTGRKLMVLALVLSVLAVGAFAAFAQDDDPTPPFGPGGMMGRGWGMGYGEPMWERVAEALGIDAATLWDELRAGKTVADLAAEQGVDLQTVTDAIVTEATEHLNAMVAAGYITQEQADAHLAYMRENMLQHLESGFMFGGMGFGRGGMMGRGGMGRMGRGMDRMGRGAAGAWNCPMWDNPQS